MLALDLFRDDRHAAQLARCLILGAHEQVNLEEEVLVDSAERLAAAREWSEVRAFKEELMDAAAVRATRRTLRGGRNAIGSRR